MAKARIGRPKGPFTQHRRLDKLTSILGQNPKGVSLDTMAEALNVSTRSVRRYLKEMERKGELEAVPTRRGGALLWRFRTGETARKIELRRTQVYALLAARRVFEPLKGTALYDEIDFAVKKLSALAQRPGRGPNAGLADARLEDRFLYIPFAPKDYGAKTDELDDLFQSVSDLRPLTLSYKGAGKSTEERITIHPYALVLHKDSIYCVGRHLAHKDVRTFLLDRMRDTEASTHERFELPADFSIDDYFQGELGIWKAAKKQKVVIDFDEQGAEYIRMRKVHPTQKLAATGNGVRLTMTVGNLNQLTSWILEWGARARVVEPPELVDRVREELEGALRGYRKK